MEDELKSRLGSLAVNGLDSVEDPLKELSELKEICDTLGELSFLKRIAPLSITNLTDEIFNLINEFVSKTYMEPNRIKMHPETWYYIRTLKTSDNVYAKNQLWGLPVVWDSFIPKGMIIVDKYFDNEMEEITNRDYIKRNFEYGICSYPRYTIRNYQFPNE